MKAWHNSVKNNSIWTRYRQWKTGGTGGFTLVELIVTLVVLGILATLAVMSLMGWQDYADFKRNNEFAKSIFQAAQIQLTQYGERGQLTELTDAVTDGGKAPRSEYLLSEQGNLTSDNGTLDVASEAENTIWENGFGGNIYYLMVEKGDYAHYVNELKGLSAAESRAYKVRERRIKALFDMIDPYISDKSMLDAAICIEFDPDPKVAQVYSVFYNYKAERFAYEGTGSSGITGGTAPIRDRSVGTRREAKTGYFGVDTMARGTDTYISRPVISSVRLNNEDTLNLSWTTKGDGGRELTRLIYSITLYGQNEDGTGTDKPLLTLVLGKTNMEQISVTDKTISAVVSRPNADGSWDTEELSFPMTVNTADSRIALVLDGLDLNADEKTDPAEFKETASIQRLGLDVDMIYAVITGSRSGMYDITIKKQSNSEHQYFGGMTVNENGSVTYAVENARHLNNIRYRENDYAGNDGAAAPRFIYQLSRDISWEYALNSGAVYRKAEQLFPENGDITLYYFKPILTLRHNSVLESNNGEQGRSLIKFRFDAAHTVTDEETYLGLVAENKGNIRNLSMKGVYVNGVSETAGVVYAGAAGAFCGVNQGKLYNLSVEDSSDGVPSRIHGFTYAGGIAGRSAQTGAGDAEQTYEKLTNRANVTGQWYVGGIVGSLETGGGKITVSGCRNFGKVRGEISETGKESCFFGGITGYAGVSGETGTVDATTRITLSGCQSSPYYTEDEIDTLIKRINEPDSAELMENYVGGIVGYNDVAQILNCSTEPEQAGNRGYVIGKDYVGGIVGCNSSRVRLTGGTSNRNQVHVIGHSYVGGIAGCNAVGTLNGNRNHGFQFELSGKETTAQWAEIRGWINEGIITSTGDYAGGITGYNSETGVIMDSYSNVEYDGSASALAQITSRARFAGGVAGYNKGMIVGTAGKITTVSVVSGRDYVGGVVGCNDVGGEIIQYELEGGYVEGSHFVGGFIGLNMESGIFNDFIKSNPNKVFGDYFVGGVIGGNLVPVDESVSELRVSFETDNFLGDLLAEQGAFAGGFIGYNYLLRPAAAEPESNGTGAGEISHILAAANWLCEDGRLPVLEASAEEVSAGKTLEELLEGLLTSGTSSYANESTHMVITASDAGATASHQTLGSVRGKVYVGGVVGYNQSSTWLEIRNVENITPVEATGYIECVEEGMAASRRYSYAGGMTGKVGARVTLDNCSNRDAGEVRGKGTYTGGLAEINFGTVKNCTSGNIGDGLTSYVGGIVGVNADRTAGTAGGTTGHGRGLLTNCSVGGQVSGVNYVGGLAAENYGVIRYTSEGSTGDSGAEAVVAASGRCVGGIVGYAHKDGEIQIDSDVTLDINVLGTAQYAGGIAGINAGRIRIAETEGTQSYVIENKSDNTIIGRNYVGGFIGMQLEPGTASQDIVLRRFENHAVVQAACGYAGGIVALVQKNTESGDAGASAANRVKLERCSNYGRVEVLSDEDSDEEEILPDDDNTSWDDGLIPDIDEDGIAAAGGITAINHGIISLCGNYGEVSANSGYMGGIAALNYNQIERSQTAAGDTSFQPTSTTDALELSGDLRVGGIAAVNKEGALIRQSVVRSVFLRNQSSTESGSIGGIAALNEGSIEDCHVGVDLDMDALAADNDRDYSDLRAEAAYYTEHGMGSSSFYKNNDYAQLSGNSVLLVSYAPGTDMGGVAGVNENLIKGDTRKFGGSDYYTTVAADLRFDSDSMNYFGNIGGIAGVNGGIIEKYEFSGYVRGSAGDPANTPEYSASYDLERNKSRIYGYGGIVGRNGNDLLTSNTAKIERCYLGMAKIQGTGDGSNRANVGGVVGFNGTGASIRNIAFSQMSGDDGVGVTKYFTQPLDASYVKGNSANWNPATAVSASGTVWVNVTNYGHLGGVAGYNRGSISDINWTRDYIEKREIEGSTNGGYFPNGKKTNALVSEVDNTGVLVTSGAGLVGGITGYNHRTGSVSQAVTGRKWLVSATSQQLGNGIGGIIGYNISEQDIESCDNHATVFKKADDAVGGITGCQETGTSSSWRYYDCKNYGMLYANNRGGGIIGVWKYKGGTLENCQNYGQICSLNTCGGGIVALVESVSGGDTINLTRCENFGEVYTNNNLVSLSGILSYVDDRQAPLDIQISECVNTGNMVGNYMGGELTGRGGIFATAAGNSKVNIRYCRNYGFIREDSRYYGITQGNANTSLTYCFGAANGNTKVNPGTWGIQFPISQNSAYIENSYYFVDWQSITGGQGTKLKISGRKALAGSKVIVPDMGNYDTYDIVFKAADKRTRRNSDESYRLCKGISGREGLDVYLKAVGASGASLSAPVLEMPTVAANGEYSVSWNAVSGARYYNVVCDYLDADKKVIGTKSSEVYTTSASISSTFEADGMYALGVQVRVQALSESASSDFSNTQEMIFGTRLPYPQISWEYAELSDDGYRVVLDNRDEYVKFVKENMLTGMSESDTDYSQKLQEELKQISIYTTGIDNSFTVWEGGYKGTGGYVSLKPPTDGGISHKTITSYAKYTGTYSGIGQSVQVIRESQFPGKRYYEQYGSPKAAADKFADVQLEPTKTSADIGFAGKTVDELAYYMELKNNGAETPWEVYYRSEIMADDPELGIPVAVSVAEQTPIPSTKGETISVKLSNFPKDFLDKGEDGAGYRYQNVWVRTYPAFMANNVVRQGWKVSEEEYTADELGDITVTDNGEPDDSGKLGGPLLNTSVFGKKSVREGYVIVWSGKNKDGENLYSVYYNTLLKAAFEGDDPEDDRSCLYQDTTYMKYQIFYHGIDLASAINNVQPKPTAYVNAAYNTSGMTWENGTKYDEADQFVLTWDQAAAGTDLPAYPGAETDADYKNAVYRLTLTGRTADGKTTVLENEREIITADRTGTGYNSYTADSRNWDYTNIHVKLTRVGEVNASGITTKFPAAAELDFPMRRRLSQVRDVTISLKRNDQGVVIKDALHYDISFNGITDEAEKGALSGYRIMVKNLNDETKTKSTDVAPDQIRESTDGRLTTDLDLSEFRAERISITVQAIANGNDTIYRNGLLSPAREMTVPNRLLPPQMGKPDDSSENNMTALDYAEDKVMTVQEFTDAALTLEMKADAYETETAQVKYQIALELYITSEDAAAGENPIEASDAGLPQKSDVNKITMTSGGAGTHSYSLKNLPITYAGKWVRVVLRSLGSNSISSVWTDDAEPGYPGTEVDVPDVEPCMVFKLPAVQVDPVMFRELDDSEAWEEAEYTVYEAGEPVTDEIGGAETQVEAAQRWVWFDTVDYADDYQITLIQTPQQADQKAADNSDVSKWMVSDVNWMTLTKVSEDTYELFYRSTEGADAGTAKTETRTIKIGGEAVEIPYQESIRIVEEQAYYIKATARLELKQSADGEHVSVGILLPDCRMDDETQMIFHPRTEQILVQSIAAGAEAGGGAGAYRNSRWALVSWSDDNLIQSSEPIDQEATAAEPSSPPGAAEAVTTINDVTYTSRLEGTTRYLVRITSAGGDELGLLGVPVNTENTTIGSFLQSVWFPTGFEKYAGQTVKLEFRSIFDVNSANGGGISNEYTMAYEVDLPELPIQADETMIASKMAEPAQYKINVTEDTGLWMLRRRKTVSTCVLTGAQKTLVWDYDLSDTTVAGYELSIGGSQLQTEFKENLDLHKGFFGAMPGVRDYLVPGGKLLYTVNYHVDGEVVTGLNREHPLATDSDATPSNTDTATASDSDMGTGSNWSGEPDVLTLECRLQAEYVETENGESVLRFTLTLPDLSFDWMQDDAAELYREAFEEGLYQTESFRLMPIMTERYYKKPETVLDLTEMRGDLQE